MYECKFQDESRVVRFGTDGAGDEAMVKKKEEIKVTKAKQMLEKKMVVVDRKVERKRSDVFGQRKGKEQQFFEDRRDNEKVRIGKVLKGTKS